MTGEIERRHGYDPAAARAGRRRGTYDGPRYQHAPAPGELDPEWVMAGVDVPAGKRLYASKDLKGTAFRLEMHPSVEYAVRANWIPDYTDFVTGREPHPFHADIPVKVTTDLPRGAWRLLVVTEDVIDGGTMSSAVAKP